ncbi:MAG: MgtC/SapB family protein [Planctomycetes bacterium]|nr:MgtC/SapB family protein [Planctomycetota bacterium]
MDQLALIGNLALALVLGAAVGLERQWRQRLAGLRTNTLVSLGAASFASLALTIPDETSPTRVAAQVVSGIGFLGAGVIFREGATVRGINTAATLWCSGAIGVLAGSGQAILAAALAGAVVGVNLLFRPIVRLLHRQPAVETEARYRLTVTCRAAEEERTRALLLQGVAADPLLRLHGVESTDLDPDRVEVVAVLSATRREDALVERIVGRLSLEQAVSAARWAVDFGAEA